MEVYPMKKFSQIRLLFPLFVFLLWAPSPSYCAIAYVESSTATCAQTFGTAASRVLGFQAATVRISSDSINYMGAGS
jgi:purine-cytosine permease-like protein